MVKKRGWIIAALTAAVFIAVLLLVSGFVKKTDAILMDCTFSEDGSEVTVKAGVAGSVGFIRSVKARQEDGRLYLTFYSTFGGINSRFGAKGEFKLDLKEPCEEVWLYVGGEEGYRKTLQKNAATGEWERVPLPLPEGATVVYED